MTLLLTTDLHFSNKPRDKYRFGLFDFLVEQIAKYKVNLVVILGDLTDEKDNHSSRLVNEIVEGLHKLSDQVPVVVLKGNHDYLADPDSPFFDFLNRMKRIRFVTKPQTWVTSEGSKLLFLPHFNDEAAWDNFRLDTNPDFAFIHQTVTGAISESGRRLDGFSLKPLKRLKARAIFGGDVHKPHTIDPVTYVGPPYHVRFGDNFEPRCLILNEETGKYKEVQYQCPRKWSLTIREPEELQNNKRLRRGDQIKVTMELTREEIVEWPVYKDRIVEVLKALGLESYGVELKASKSTRRRETNEVSSKKAPSNKDVLVSFSNYEKLPGIIRKAGLALLDE